MPFVAGIVSAIASIIATVASTIASIVSVIVSAIWSVVTAIATSIAGFISSVATAVWGFIKGVFWGIWAFLSDVFSAIGLLFQGAMTVSEVWQTIVISYQLNVSSVFSTLFNVFNTILKPIRDVINLFKDYYQRFRNSVIGEIVDTLKGYGETLGLIFDIGKIISYIKRNQYGQAILYMMVTIDEKMRSDRDNVIKRIDNQLTGFMRDVNSVFNYFREDITFLDTLSSRYEMIFKEIGKSFGIREITELGQWIGDIRKKYVGETREAINRFSRRVKDLFLYASSPVTRLIQDYYWVMRDYRNRISLFNFDYYLRTPKDAFTIRAKRKDRFPRLRREVEEYIERNKVMGII